MLEPAFAPAGAGSIRASASTMRSLA